MTEPARSYSPSEVYLVDLVGRLHAGQHDILRRFADTSGRRFVVCCNRRDGKSTLCCSLAIGTCMRQPNRQVRYAAPTAKMVKTIVEPLMRALLEGCPDAPQYHRQEGIWRFSNGSEIHVAGCDNGGHERLRGVSTHLAIVDEAGFVDDLDYVVKSILLPQTITTDGRVLLVSTPSRTPAHSFATYCTEAESEGAYVHRTIFDSPHITDEQRAEYMRESGGAESSDWRREYLAEFVVDEASAVVPEFSRHEADICIETPRPSHYDAYVSLDVGFHDLSVALYAHLDFEGARVVVEDETVHRRQTSDIIEAAAAAKERELWDEKAPHLRVVDAPEIVIAELNKRGRSWVATRKDDKEAQVNALRRAVAEHRLIIHPRCTTLRAHLRHAIWNRSRTSYERSGDFGHFDAVDAAVYLVRNVNRHRNPFPALPPGVTRENHHIPAGVGVRRSKDAEVIASLFKRS